LIKSGDESFVPDHLPVNPPSASSLLAFPSCPYCSNDESVGSVLTIDDFLPGGDTHIHASITSIARVPEPPQSWLAAAAWLAAWGTRIVRRARA
jgi:hypothetical protein